MIVIILAVLTFAYNTWWLPKKNAATRMDNFLAKIDIAKVDKIIIKRAETDVILSKAGQRWRVNSPGEWFVHPLLMDAVFQGWQKAAGNDLVLVSNNPEIKKDFQLDDDLTVEFFQADDRLGAWVIGSSSGLTTYLSSVDDQATYEVKGDLRGVFAYEEWRDFSVWRETDMSFNSLEVQYNGRGFKLFKEGDEWLAADRSIKLNQGKVDRLVSLMTDLSASGIAEDQTGDYGLAKSRFKIIAGGGVDRQLVIGSERMAAGLATGEFYIKTTQNDNIYLIRRDQRDIFAVALKDLQD